MLRAVAGAGATVSRFRGVIGVAILLYLVHGLRLTPVLLGPLFAVGGISAVLGAAAASRLLRRWGLGRTMVSSLLLASVAGLCLPLPGGPVWQQHINPYGTFLLDMRQRLHLELAA